MSDYHLLNNREAVPPDLLNYSEAAEFLSVARGTLYCWVHRQEIPFIRLGKRVIRFSRIGLTAWLKSRTVGNGT